MLAVAFALHAGTGTDALNFLKIKPSARGASLGEGFVAVANDANAAFYNPAGLTQLSNIEFSLLHMIYMAETSYEYASFALPVGENLRLGGYLVYLNYGSIGRTGETLAGDFAAGTGSYNPSSLAVALSGAMRLGELSLGVNIKYALESIDTLTITGVLADAGILTSIDGVKVGAFIYNIGMVSMDNAPMGARIGGSSRFTAFEEKDLLVAVGINYVLASSKISGSAGAELNLGNFIFLRGSYALLSDSDSLNLGLGFRQDLGGFVGELAYNFSLLGDLGEAHRISVGIKLGADDAVSKGKSNKKPIVGKKEQSK